MSRSVWVLLLLLVLQLPWLNKPVHYDEANFLVLARGAVLDPWRPHLIHINWQGTEQPAFEVLSNPPGIAWWLAPVLQKPVVQQRLWMLCWLPLSWWGACRLGSRFLGNPESGALLLLGTPVAMLAAGSLLPDAPLYALVLAGSAGWVEAIDSDRRAAHWAILCGMAGIFRYSALPLPMVLGLWALLQGRRPWAAIWGWLPLLLLAVHDKFAYGAVHLLAMGHFQAVTETGGEWLHKAAAALAMLGGAAALPLVPWSLEMGVGAIVGAALGWPYGAMGMAFAAAGGAALAASFRRGWWATWAVGGFFFLLSLRFVALRYWLPFLPPILLALHLRSSSRVRGVAAGITILLGVGLQADEVASARAQEWLADQVKTASPVPGLFTGHWGWQWAMERRGWRPAEEGMLVPAGVVVARPRQAWPQPVELKECVPIWEGQVLPTHSWLPRGYSEAGRANLHACWIIGDPPMPTIVPWTFAGDAYESVTVCRER